MSNYEIQSKQIKIIPIYPDKNKERCIQSSAAQKQTSPKFNRNRKGKVYLFATKASDRSEQCLTRTSVRPPALQTTTDRSILSTRRSNSGVQKRGNSAAEPKGESISSTELRHGSLQAWFHALHTRIAPRHRSSKGRREKMSMRHS